MSKQVVILHGWSDKSDSFKPLAAFLKKSGFTAVPIFLGDYISMYNDVTIDDVVKRMEALIRERMALPASSKKRLGPSFHMVVHSTGGLVARRWIAKYYAGRDCPVKNLLMLAPANFGSVLAHKGRSMLARVAKGWNTGFETGNEMLYSLELGSPFQWELARSDLFSTKSNDPVLYGKDRVRPYVIVGSYPYDSAVRKIVNENASDGTVRVAAANLNAHGVTIDFTGDSKHLIEPKISQWSKRGGADNRFPLAVVPDRNHSTVKEPDSPGYAEHEADQRRLGQLIVRALKVTNAQQYLKVREEWDEITAQTRTFAGDSDEAEKHRRAYFKGNKAKSSYFHEHYQVHVRALDEFRRPIDDYFLTFMPHWKEKSFLGLRTKMTKESSYFHDKVLAQVHRHRREEANVCLFMDRYAMMGKGGFYERVAKDKFQGLAFTVTAEDPGERVAYFSRAKGGKRGLIALHGPGSDQNRWLKRHCTHFVELIIPRAAVDEVFTLKRY
jgi:alpha-beta hydrolase superfamily lysophospholipase